MVLTAEQMAVLDAREARRVIVSQVPAAILLGHPAETDDGLYVYDDPRLTGDDIDLVLYLIDNPTILDAIAAEMPDQEETP